jgi:thiol-disulfide isomerase/thioredoxin
LLISACAPSQSEESPVPDSVAAAPVNEPDTQSEVPDQAHDEIANSSKEMALDSTEEMAADSTDEMATGSTEEKTTDSIEDEAMGVERPAWQQLPLTNARTGETFTLADFAGQTVFVETMATWCSNCRRQLTNVKEAKLLLGDDVVFLALSVETNIDDGTLANYADGQVFDWLFSVITPELLGQLVDEFGRTITVPPSTPHFIIRADGSTTELVTGIDPAGDIVSQINAAQG